MSLIYELTASTWPSDATAWDNDAVTVTTSGDELHLSVPDRSASLVREPLPVAPGVYLLALDTPALPASAGQGIASARGDNETLDLAFLAAEEIADRPTTRRLVRFTVGPDDAAAGLALHLRYMSSTSGPFVITRFALYSVDNGPLLDQLQVQILTPGNSGFRLNNDRLNTGRLGDTATARQWTEYLCDARSVTITRGAQVDGITTTTEAGTLALTVAAAPDSPPGLGLKPNLPIRVRAANTETTAYTGTVDDLQDTFTDAGRYDSTVIPATDAVQSLANTMRYGADVIDHWDTRVARLMGSARVPWEFRGSARFPVCGRIVYESTLANHLQVVCNTSGGRWYVGSDNVVRIEHSDFTAQGRPVRLRFSDVHNPSDPTHRCYTDARIAYDTRTTVNDLTLANHGAQWEADQGDWRADDRKLGPYSDMTSVATWGSRAAEIPTCLEIGPGNPEGGVEPPVGDNARALADVYLASAANPRPRVTSLTYNATDDVDIACLLDVFDYVDVECKGIVQPSRIVGLQHVITPTRWMVTLTLQERTVY